MSNFDPNKLKAGVATTKTRAPRSERVFMIVDKYETPSDSAHFAVGKTPDGKPIRVRLTTVAERVADGAKFKRPLSEASVRAQYQTGEHTRDTIAAKASNNIKLLAFDHSYRIEDADGIPQYRAHWPQTISTQPDAEIMKGKGHIRLRDAFENAGGRVKAQAYIEMIKESQAATAENIDDLLHSAVSIKDSQGRARDPLAIIRVTHDDKVVATPRLYPSRDPKEIFDQATGEKRTVHVRASADKTMSELMSAKPGFSDMQNRQLDTIRALVAGVKGLDEPKYNSQDPDLVKSIRNIYFGAKGGHLGVEVVSVDKVDFGVDSRMTYLKQKDRPHLAAYSIKDGNDETSLRVSSGYTDTVIGIQRHPDGAPYAVYASPEQMFPKTYKLNDLHLPGPSQEQALAQEQTVDIAPEQQAPEQQQPEPEVVEPQQFTPQEAEPELDEPEQPQWDIDEQQDGPSF